MSINRALTDNGQRRNESGARGAQAAIEREIVALITKDLEFGREFAPPAILGPSAGGGGLPCRSRPKGVFGSGLRVRGKKDSLLEGLTSICRTTGALPEAATRDSSQGLSEAHKREVRLLANVMRTREALLVTRVFLKAHGSDMSDVAIQKWQPLVDAVLMEEG